MWYQKTDAVIPDERAKCADPAHGRGKNSRRGARLIEWQVAMGILDGAFTVLSGSHIYEELRRGIAAGTLPPGTKLPTERALASRHGIGRKKVRRALDRLRDDGLIERRVGSGSFVRPPAGQVAPSWSAEPPSISPLDAIEARRVIEVGAVELLIARATDEDFARIESRLAELSSVHDPSAFRALMFAVNLEIIRATRNPLLVAMYEMLIAARAKAGWDRLGYLVENPEQRAASLAFMHEYLDLVRHGDARRAANFRYRSLTEMIRTILSFPDSE
jgi:DNA-binding FadR family transcriptional regulator